MKKKLLILLLTTLAMMLCLTACPTPGGPDEVKIVDLQIDLTSIPTEVEVGTTPDFTGIKATVVYSDDTTKAVTYADLTLGTIDTKLAGEKKLSVTYEGFKKEVAIIVKAKPAAKLESIKIVPGTVADTVLLGARFDLSSLQIEAKYDDGSVKFIKADDANLTVSGVDTAVAGQQTLTVTYEGKTDSVTVNVLSFSEIKVEQGTLRKRYAVGEALDKSTLRVMVYLADGSSQTMDASKVEISELDSSTVGEKTITITYQGVSVDYTVVVYEATMAIHAKQLEVLIGETLDLSNLTAAIRYSDGEGRVLYYNQNDLVVVENVDTTTAGTKTLKVKHRLSNLEATVPVVVHGVSSLTVHGIKDELLLGGQLDYSAMVVYATYTNGKTLKINNSDVTLAAFDASTAGNKTLKVTFQNASKDVAVKVCQVTALRLEGLPKSVAAGNAIDVSGLKVYGVYNDSKKSEVAITSGYTTNVASLDINSTADKKLVVTYSGAYGNLTAEYTISATPPVFTGVEVDSYVTYIELGGTYDKSSVQAYAVYGNGTKDKVSATVSDLDTATAGTKYLTVSYTDNGVTKTTNVAVAVLPVTSVKIVGGVADVVDKDGTLVTADAKIHVIFQSGSNKIEKDLTVADGVTISVAATATGGNKYLSASYLGFTDTTAFAYHVKTITKVSVVGGMPEKLYQGIKIDALCSEVEVTIEYSKGNPVSMKASALEGVAFALNGNVVTVTYNGTTIATKTCETVAVSGISALNGTVPATVLQNGTLAYKDMRLTVSYADGAVYQLSEAVSTLTIERFNTAEVGTHGVTFRFEGFETVVNILVKGVTSIELVDGLMTTVNLGQELDTSEMVVRILYTDGTYIYADTTSIHLEVGTIDTSTEGTKTLTVKYQGVEGQISIKVVKITASGLIFGAELPEHLVVRNAYKQNFKVQDEAYVVGDDNPYYFYLNVLMLDDNDDLVDINGKTLATSIKVYEITAGGKVLLEGDALTAVVAANGYNNSYDFTEAAIGRTFELVIMPADSTTYIDAASVTKSHTVKIVDGYNVYTAKELLIMNNYENDLNGEAIDSYIGQLTVVNNFLAANGIVRPANLKGLVLHCNLDIKESDLPAEYIYTYEKDGVQKKGLYEQMGVYTYKFQNPGTFSIHGNYYSIYSYNLPCVVEKGIANNDDEFSSSDLFYVKLNPDTEFAKYAGSALRSDLYEFNVSNLALRDNDPNSNDQSASERHMRGLICFKVGECVSNFNNVNVDAFMTSMVADDAFTTVNLNKVKFYNAWQGHIFGWTLNHYQDWLQGKDAEPVAGAYGNRINITDSLVAKCGGPVILGQNPDRSNRVNATMGIDVVVDDKSEIYSYVTGQEAWFVAVGQSSLAKDILAMNTFVKGTAQAMGKSASYTSNQFIHGVDTVNMVMVVMGSGLTVGGSETYSASFTRNGVTALNMVSNTDTTRPRNQMYDLYLANTGGVAPIFQSSAGGTAFTDAQTGCYGLETGAIGAPLDNFFQGDYLTLYYSGAGIVLEYYH